MDTQYAIAVAPNYYQPEIQGRDRTRWIVEDESDYLQTPKLFESVAGAREYIEEELGSGIYYLQHGEAGRPEYWVVDDVTVATVQAHWQDNGLYNWPDDCDEWECADRDGSVCGECRQCLDFMAWQDGEILRRGAVEA